MGKELEVWLVDCVSSKSNCQALCGPKTFQLLLFKSDSSLVNLYPLATSFSPDLKTVNPHQQGMPMPLVP